MSLLDTIKSLFCPNKSSDSESIKVNEEEKITPPQTTTQDKLDPTAAAPLKKEPAISAPEHSIAIEIPQDSTLKRHYISALKTKIETEMGPYPTDSNLKRQYTTTVQTKLDELLN